MRTDPRVPARPRGLGIRGALARASASLGKRVRWLRERCGVLLPALVAALAGFGSSSPVGLLVGALAAGVALANLLAVRPTVPTPAQLEAEGPRPRLSHDMVRSLEASDPERALRAASVFLPPFFLLVDLQVLEVGFPLLGVLAGVAALKVHLDLDAVDEFEGHHQFAARLAVLVRLGFLWGQILLLTALATGVPGGLARALTPGQLRVACGLLPLALVAHWKGEPGWLERGLARGVHSLLRVWHGLLLRSRHLGERELRVVEEPNEVLALEGGEAPEAPRCPCCDDPLADLPGVRCQDCDTWHHQDCWDFLGGCSIYGCGGQVAEGGPEPEE